MSEKKNWQGRGFTSLLTMAGFIIMAVTGLILYVVPQGRIAYWTHWRFAGLDKTQWGDIHILASILFIVVGIFHIVYNWKVFWNYLRNKAGGGIKLKKELAVSLLIAALLVCSAALKLPPLSYLLDLNAAIKDAWVSDKDTEPPFGHAELLSLKVFCEKTDIPYQKAKALLGAAGIQGLEEAKSLDELAKRNDRSPLELYRLIRHLEQKKVVVAPSGFANAEQVQQVFAGKGIGNKSLDDIAQLVGQSVETLRVRLKVKGLSAEKAESIKQAAGRQGIAPLQLVEAALVEAK